MEVGLVRKVDIDHEMQQSYLDFAMSVIVARALPDARDGLKPVQRRILYAMYDMGLRPDTAYKKSARIVGEVLGKYHPHGDMAVYEAMARLAQDFSMRYPLVDGQGNFGSVDGDPPAAMRYTEARLKPFAIDLLNQIDRDTVDFIANFDESLAEPVVLPAALPNLLVNGSTGIAVGMATNIPPHNLTEVIDALAYMLEQWDRLDDINVSDLMRFIKGPDLPTGGVILQDATNDLLTTYATGKGRFIVRGQVHMEDTGRGRSRLIITELPYMTNKAGLIERIADLVREGHLEGISDLRDESDRQGMRIVIELSKTGEPEEVLRELYRRTPLESTLGITLLALVDGEPRLLTLKQALRVYLDHRLVVVKRRSEYDLSKARQRAHFLEGLRIAIANLDEVIKIIRAAADVETARERLIKRFKLSEIQAQAILDMPLRRLAALERRKIDEEYKAVVQTIKELEILLRSPKKMREVVETELMQMRQAYGDKRRTRIVSLKEGETARTLLMTTDLTPAEEAWVGITADGLIARLAGGEAPRGSGRQALRWLLRTNTHHTLYLVTEGGQCAAVAVHALPEAEKPSDGIPVSKASAVKEGERLAAVFSTPARNGDPHADRFVLTASEQGLVKKSSVADLPGPSAQCFTLVKVNSDDRLVGVLLTTGADELLLATARGMAIRFAESEVRAMGLVAAGVNGIKLAAGDQVVAVERYNSGTDVLLVAENGSGWRIPAAEFPLQGRYGQGVIACKITGTRLVGLMMGKPGSPAVILPDKAAAQAVKVGDLSSAKRAASGKALYPMKAGDRVLALSVPLDTLVFWDPSAAEKKPRAARKPSTATGGEAETVLEAQPAQTQLSLLESMQEAPRKTATAVKAADGKAAPKPAAKKTAAVKPAGATVKKAEPAKKSVEVKPAAGSTKKETTASSKAAKTSTEKAARGTKPASAAKEMPAAAGKVSPVKASVKESKPAAKKAADADQKKPAPVVKKATTSKTPGKIAAKTPPETKPAAKSSAKTSTVKTESKPPAASTGRGRVKQPPAKEPEIGLVGQVRTSGKVVEVNSGRVKTTRTKKTDETTTPTQPATTRKKPAAKTKP